MNPNVRLIAQFLISTEILGTLIWLIHIGTAGGLSPEAASVVKSVTDNFVPIVTGVVGFWIGSSLSSAAKDHTIAQAATKVTTP